MEKESILNHTLIRDPKGTVVMLSLMTLLLRNCQNSLQFDLYVSSVLQAVSILLSEKSSPIFQNSGSAVALFDTVVSILGLLNPNIFAENVGVKFGFLLLTSMLKNALAKESTLLKQGDSSHSKIDTELWDKNIERIEHRMLSIFGP